MEQSISQTQLNTKQLIVVGKELVRAGGFELTIEELGYRRGYRNSDMPVVRHPNYGSQEVSGFESWHCEAIEWAIVEGHPEMVQAIEADLAEALVEWDEPHVSKLRAVIEATA